MKSASNLPIRTLGDGSEHCDTNLPENRRKLTSTSSADSEKVDKLGKQFLSSKIHSSSFFFNPSVSSSNIHFPSEVIEKKKFFLIPKLVPSKPSNFMTKNKSPKLVLMEPYRACVTPIAPIRADNYKVKKPKSNKNNLDLNELVRHVNVTKISAFNEFDHKLDKCDEVAQLKKERDQLESQLKFQTQVNNELKGLLVHCLGEDVQSKVSNLTEDKMKIAENLSTNTEKIEFLAGQSEVWKSKFLASSLMLEELAKWKACLSEKNAALIASNRKLLETMAAIREMEVELYQNLKFLAGYQESSLKTSNVIDLTGECLNISQQLVLNAGKIGMPEPVALSSSADSSLTTAEKLSLAAIQETNQILISTDDAFKAICSQANHEYQKVKSQNEDSFEIVEHKDAN